MARSFEMAYVDASMKMNLLFYRSVLKGISDKDSMLSADEAYCLDAIYSLDKPTIGEFAHFMQISPQSAAYKINSLVRKGYITRTQGDDDKRQFYLEVTSMYKEYRETFNKYVYAIGDKMRERYSDKEMKKFTEMFDVMVDEFLPNGGTPLA